MNTSNSKSLGLLHSHLLLALLGGQLVLVDMVLIFTRSHCMGSPKNWLEETMTEEMRRMEVVPW